MTEETKSVRWTKTVSRGTTFHNNYLPKYCQSKTQAHLMTGYKTLQYRLGLLWQTFQSKIKHTSFKANREFCVRAQGRQYWFHCSPLSNFFYFKHHSELNENVACKFHDTAVIWTQCSLLLHTHVYILWCKQTCLFWTIYI